MSVGSFGGQGTNEDFETGQATADLPNEEAREPQEPDYSILHSIGKALEHLPESSPMPFTTEFVEDHPKRSDAAASVSQSLQTIDLEIFKITEMGRRWIAENGLTPYKLALITGSSPSQVHRIMERGWSPSLKLARKIASSLPADWIEEFERDCNACLPRVFYLQPSPFTKSGPINQLVRSIGSNDTATVIEEMARSQFSFRRVQRTSPSKTAIFTARHTAPGMASLDYAPPPPRLNWVKGVSEAECRNCVFSIHRTPIETGRRTRLYTIHVAEFEGDNSAFQFWKAETFKDIRRPRQLDILRTYREETE